MIYPGFLEHTTEQKRMKEGIPLDGKLLEKMRALGGKMGVALPI